MGNGHSSKSFCSRVLYNSGRPIRAILVARGFDRSDGWGGGPQIEPKL